MEIIDQKGDKHITYGIEFDGEILKCTPRSDKRKKNVIGVYATTKRAAQVFEEIHNASMAGVKSFVMPQE